MITKDSELWLAALALIPEKWQANCPEHQGDDHCSKIPDITPDLLYAIRRAIEARGYTWVIRYTAGKNRTPNEAYSMTIFKDSHIVVHEDAATEDEVIIRAAASLQEAK